MSKFFKKPIKIVSYEEEARRLTGEPWWLVDINGKKTVADIGNGVTALVVRWQKGRRDTEGNPLPTPLAEKVGVEEGYTFLKLTGVIRPYRGAPPPVPSGTVPFLMAIKVIKLRNGTRIVGPDRTDGSGFRVDLWATVALPQAEAQSLGFGNGAWVKIWNVGDHPEFPGVLLLTEQTEMAVRPAVEKSQVQHPAKEAAAEPNPIPSVKL